MFDINNVQKTVLTDTKAGITLSMVDNANAEQLSIYNDRLRKAGA